MIVTLGGFVSNGPSLTGGALAFKARGCPPICCANRFPPRPLRGVQARLHGPDNHRATRLPDDVLNPENRQKDDVMTIMQTIEAGRTDAVALLIAGLESEFGAGAARALADRFLAAEDSDFHWDARLSERWLGCYESIDEEDLELDRIAIVGRLDGEWFTAICIVDGEGMPHGMIARRSFESEQAARKAHGDAR